MSGVLCLQGGREFTEGCIEMDRTVIAAAGATSVGVLAGAARIGSDYDGAVGRATRHYEALGVSSRAITDPRLDATQAIDDLETVDMIVLPGGSPTSLLDVLYDIDGGVVGQAVLARWAGGAAVSGASAGAMAMCTHAVRPDRGDVVDGLGMSAGLALPHWEPDTETRWTVPDETMLWGLTECGGVLIDGGVVRAVGRGEPAQRIDGVWTPITR